MNIEEAKEARREVFRLEVELGKYFHATFQPGKKFLYISEHGRKEVTIVHCWSSAVKQFGVPVLLGDTVIFVDFEQLEETKQP